MAQNAIGIGRWSSPYEPAALVAEQDIRESIQSDPAPRDVRIGVLNPWALTELLLGPEVTLKNDEAGRKLVGDTLGMPYEKLLDPKSNSPLFPHLKFENGKLLDVTSEGKAVDRASRWGKNADKIEALLGGKSPQAGATNEPYEPSDSEWADRGVYSPDTIDFDDVVQGAIGDCWLIAAFSSIAWVWSLYAELTETGQSDPDHNTSLKLYSKGGSHDAPTAIVTVSDQLLFRRSNGSFVGTRSRNGNELWPGIWEKAFAKWSTSNSTDRPNIFALAGGDPIRACAQILNRNPVYHQVGKSKDWKANWTLLTQKYTSNGKAKVPLTAWTFPSTDRDYNGTGLVALHAYSILGVCYDQEGFRFVIMRNPWGRSEPVDGTFRCQSGWINLGGRDINLDNDDGIFSIEIGPFCNYFTMWGAALQ